MSQTPPIAVSTSGRMTPSSEILDPNSKSRAIKEARIAAKAAKNVKSSTTRKEKQPKKEMKTTKMFIAEATPSGQKKNSTHLIASGYNPLVVESAWYDWWDAQGFFSPQLAADGKPKPEGLFVIPMPPPTVTGSLHIGHALTIAIQDSLARWNRMLGKTTLFVPGFDHAATSTQSVVEKRLYKATGQTRHDLGREKFLHTVLAWKDEYRAHITAQLRRLGVSCDWNRTAFTMDETFSKAVIETFCRLFEEGIIYRANRLVNWCVQLNTTLSNMEADQKQLDGPTMLSVPGYGPTEKFEFGVLTSFAYQVEGSDEKIVVATTRPETMLGDTAVAVHPSDPRYKGVKQHLHGKFVVHPFLNRHIPVITDDIVVDMEYGTGAVKITPAHDPKDFEVGVRHKLEFINIMNDDGTLNANAGDKFQGMKRFHARVAVTEALKEKGLYIEKKANPMQILVCSKSGDVIEPLMRPQWWVSCTQLAEEAIKRTRAGELSIAPKQSEAEWYRWLENIQDWCISRQLWWGHRCPAYFVRIEGKTQKSEEGTNWVVGRTFDQALERAKVIAGDAKFILEQDEDVLDTWFSSGLWPFSIMGWPDETQDLQLFYPSSILETGWDILFFWVARMVLLGLHLTGKMPFKEVYCHAMVHAQGRKMSKSLGNVVDPIDVIQGLTLEALHDKLHDGNLDDKEIAKAKAEQKKDFPKGIPQCGTDAMRFALCAYSGGGRDINLDILRVEGYRKFCNKIYNATKFALLKMDKSFVPEPTSKPTGNESLVERWILHKLNITACDVNKHMAERNFMAATTSAHNFWLYELCDVYIEAMKPVVSGSAGAAMHLSTQQTLYTCLDLGLRLLHPFMPFVTEELWQHLPRRPNDSTPSIMIASYPTLDQAFIFETADKEFDVVLAVIKAGRSLASSYNLQSEIQIYLHVEIDDEATLLQSYVPTMITLMKGCKVIEIVKTVNDVPPGCGSSIVSHSIVVYALVRGRVDLDAEIAKCEKKLNFASLNLEKVRKSELAPNYEGTVPANVRLMNEEKRKTMETEVATLRLSKETFLRLNEQSSMGSTYS